MVDFSVIIPVRNRAEEVVRCIESCYAQEYPATKFEVLVVDNASTDETARAAMRAGARVLNEHVPNRSLARNAGATVARGEWLAFIDSDCEAHPAWLLQMKAAIDALPENEKIGALAGHIESGPPQTAVEAYISERGWIDQARFTSGGEPGFPPFAAAANLVVLKEAFRAVEGFDPAMPPAEDADLCWRLSDAGWALTYIPQAKVVHHHRATLKAMANQAEGYGRGRVRLSRKHADRLGQVEPIRTRWIWSIKGFLKTPLGFVANSGHARQFAFYDGIANAAYARGFKKEETEAGEAQ